MCEHVLAVMTSQRKLVLDQARSSPLAVGSGLFTDLKSAKGTRSFYSQHGLELIRKHDLRERSSSVTSQHLLEKMCEVGPTITYS
ncbi:hypothetical protein Q3G72_027707 [Acer saccharum]|nr:hypothetical protein Q3G72_027707 [Acer saccharum]